MASIHRKYHRRYIVMCAAVLLFACTAVPVHESRAASTELYVNAFSVAKLPNKYFALESFFASLKNTGANTLIIDLPLTDAGLPAMNVIPNVVYLAHQAGIKLHVVIPTRVISGAIAKNDDWEDSRYDLATESYQRTGKLDLFHQPAVDYITSLAKELSAFSVDAILLGSDFSYGPTEGMSRTAVNAASLKLGSDIHPPKLYRKIEKGPDGPFVRDFTELFHRWTAVKRDRLVDVYLSIVKSVRSANSSVKIGMPIPITYPLMNAGEIFVQHAYDLNVFRNLDVDYFWIGIAYREMQKRQGLSYRQTTELVSRIAHAAITASKDESKTIMVVPMIDESSLRSLPYSEIEEITSLLKQAGETGRAYGIAAGVPINGELTRKLFRR